ncbi:Zinc/iron permease [Neocallimastix californiae]|uniref:Zinc/iron permease n=1 Tax=Neocallimastix californiae TaxID=1754190 RepID=A0A1Y2DPQ8_9FUNG|nr:Zinc/iron permease [Neocallimastix californiae]|eukprot:ORY61096.1 Zinc/iron permease [Neocallimastix californiae]
MFTQLIWTHGIHHHDDDEEGEEHEHEGEVHDHEHENEGKTYPVGITIIGIAAVLLCSFLGTVLPIIFRKKSFFREDTLLFSCIKLFGTGVILAVAFIHMIIPAGQILTSEYTYEIFYEKYTSFAGVFAILGIILTHVIQVYTSHFLYKNNEHHIHKKSSSDSSITLSVDSDGGDITEEKKYHTMNNKKEVVSAVDGCAEEQHGILHMMENKEKQIICYLLEIGISLHSILIGIAFGMTNDEELIVLMIALIFHQFFEGVSLSSVFIEAHFKRFTAIIIMIVVYSLTLPIGGVIGILIRNAIESTDKVYLTTQGIIDAVAGGILIYDDLVNILSRHCNSNLFKKGSIMRKNAQLISFYCGIAVMAIIGIWA